MVVIGKLWETDPVEYLVQWKFPKLVAFGYTAAWDRSPISTEELDELKNKADAYRQELEGMDETNLKSLVARARKDETRRYNEYRETQERNQFFNQPKANADFPHWASASFWTLDETAALSLGKDPRVVTWKAVSPHVNISPFAKAFEARRDLVYRAGVMGQLAQQTAPSVVLAWAERMHMSMPAELVEAVKALGTQIADWKTLHDGATAQVDSLKTQLSEAHAAHMATLKEHSEYISKTRADQNVLADGYKGIISARDERISILERHAEMLSGRVAELEAPPPKPASETTMRSRERESLLKLVIGMAIKGYSYDPTAGRSPTAKEIAGDLALVGLPLDEDTVRKYLSEARQLLPGDKPEQNR